MRNYLAILSLFFVYSCKNKSENIAFERNDEIEKIVECVILEDSLNVFKSDSTAIPLSKELKKLKVHNLYPNIDHIPPKPEDGVYLDDLFHYHLNIHFIPKKDSLNLLNQNEALKTYVIGSLLSKKVKLTTYNKQKKKFKANQDAEFLFITIPLFSSDNTKAYVEVSKICFGNCGWGEAIYLERKNGKWKIVYKDQLWVE